MSEQDGFSGISDIVHLGDEEATARLLSQAVLGLWEVVNNLTRLRPTRSLRYRVTIFGSARTESGHWAYAAVRDLAAELTRLGCDIVTGGGPGLMQAANEGASIAGAEPERSSVGIRVALPFEQDVNPFVGEVYEHRTFFSRLHHFVLVSNAFVVVPGGIGTLLETMMIWQLLQVRKLHDTPLSWLAQCGRNWSIGPGDRCCARILRWPVLTTSPSRLAARPRRRSSTCFASTITPDDGDGRAGLPIPAEPVAFAAAEAEPEDRDARQSGAEAGW